MTPRQRLFSLEQFGIKLGLDNITRLLDALGHPQRAWPSVHVAGTNGKGSVTAMVERGLRSAGHRTGRYTSPHLSRVEERIAIDGRAIDAATFDAAAAELMAIIDRLSGEGVLAQPPTFFEATTAMAFEVFRRSSVGVAVVEVGLGGRFDSTNVITPQVTAITSIALDHERHLGSTLRDIAFEKAGIIKRAVPVVVGDLPAEAMEVVREAAAACGAPLVHAGMEGIDVVDSDEGHAIVRMRTPLGVYGPWRLGLAGLHQVCNAAVALRTLEVCARCGLENKGSDIERAVSDVHWPARLEWIRAGTGRILLDAAHNPDGAEACAAFVRDAGLAPLPVVVAAMRDKNVGGILRPLRRVASAFVATQADSPRSLRADEMASFLRAEGAAVDVAVVTDPLAAVEHALALAPQALVAGSIFLVGPLRERLLSRTVTAADER
jgi:dihydrofolate synthase/folylpolyglutamate synthase